MASPKRQSRTALFSLRETTKYLWDGSRLLAEYTGEGAPLAEYYSAGDRILARKMFGLHGRKEPGAPTMNTTGGLLYYSYDGLGNVSALTDRLGQVAARYRYDAFGGLLTSATAPYNLMGAFGKEFDPASGLVYFGARWYDAQTGRFTTPDPYQGNIQDPVSLHQYLYAKASPPNYIDRWGYHTVPGEYFAGWQIMRYDDEIRLSRLELDERDDEKGHWHYYKYLQYDVQENEFSDWKQWELMIPADDGSGDDGGSGGSGGGGSAPPEPTPEEKRDQATAVSGAAPSDVGLSYQTDILTTAGGASEHLVADPENDVFNPYGYESYSSTLPTGTKNGSTDQPPEGLTDLPDRTKQIEELLDHIRADAEKYRGASLRSKLSWLEDRFKPGGKYDVKLQPEWQGPSIYKGQRIEQDVPGNIGFGYGARALGVPRLIAHVGAGWVQYQQSKKDSTNHPFQYEWVLMSLGDDPRDYRWIRYGYHLYEAPSAIPSYTDTDYQRHLP